MKIITRGGGRQSNHICKYFDNYLVCFLLYYNSFSRYIFNEFHDVGKKIDRTYILNALQSDYHNNNCTWKCNKPT